MLEQLPQDLKEFIKYWNNSAPNEHMWHGFSELSNHLNRIEKKLDKLIAICGCLIDEEYVPFKSETGIN